MFYCSTKNRDSQTLLLLFLDSYCASTYKQITQVIHRLSTCELLLL